MQSCSEVQVSEMHGQRMDERASDRRSKAVVRVFPRRRMHARQGAAVRKKHATEAPPFRAMLARVASLTRILLSVFCRMIYASFGIDRLTKEWMKSGARNKGQY